jgi:transcription antitermination factor NusG
LLTNFEKNWLVLYVRTRWEKKVHNALKNINVESFLPMIQSINQWSDRKKKILKPLFPSYVFVKVNSSSDFGKALSVNGACSYISFGREYATVSGSEINNIKKLVATDKITNFEIENQIKKGDFKIINQGPLEGLECQVVKVNNQKKVVVSIDSLKQNILATVPLHFVD